MPAWNQTPDWSPIETINNGVTIALGDGFLFSDQNKIVENLQFLYNHASTQHVYVGNVTTNTLQPGQPATVTINGRYVDAGDANVDGEKELYLDFVFNIPQGIKGDTGDTGATGAAAGFGTPKVTIEQIPYDQPASLTISTSGPDTAKIFLFNFKIPQGVPGPAGIQGKTGKTPQLGIGTVTTGAPNEPADASISGTVDEPLLNLKIPQGIQGAPGKDGVNGKDGQDAVVMSVSGIIGFQVVDGHLIMYYPDGTTPPNLSINAAGHLIYTY